MSADRRRGRLDPVGDPGQIPLRLVAATLGGLSILLMEFGDFAMPRGIKTRAERLATQVLAHPTPGAGTSFPTAPV